MSTLRKRRTSRPLKLDVRRLRIRLHLATNDRETGREPSDCLGCEIWVQLGCNKNSRGLLEAPKVAIGAVKLQLVTSERCHGRGREFESRRPRHSFQKGFTSFTATNVGAKGCIFAPFLHPFFSISAAFTHGASRVSRRALGSSVQNQKRAPELLPAQHVLRARSPACRHLM